MTPLVRIRSLRKSFGTHTVLDGIDLDVHQGDVTVLLGQSGAGKSTLLCCVNHLERPDAGFGKVAGEVIGYRYRRGKLYESRSAALTAQGSRIGMVFQQFNLFPHPTVMDNILESPTSTGRATRKDATALARDLLDQVGLVS